MVRQDQDSDDGENNNPDGEPPPAVLMMAEVGADLGPKPLPHGDLTSFDSSVGRHDF